MDRGIKPLTHDHCLAFLAGAFGVVSAAAIYYHNWIAIPWVENQTEYWRQRYKAMAELADQYALENTQLKKEYLKLAMGQTVADVVYPEKTKGN